MSKYLDGTGLSYLWGKIKATFIKKSDTTAVTSVGIDTTPTANSSNLITSGGVKTALDIKQATLSTLTAYTSKGTATKVPQITTNTLGQVTNITEVTITQPDITGKADKVTSATSGNFAALDSNGNLTDSGHSHSDYLTSHQSLANYVTLDGTLNITGEKTFVGNKKLKFKQSSSTDKIGFTGYNTSNAECGNFEILPNDRAVNLGIYSPDTKPSSDWLVGFKYQAKDSAGTVHKFGLRVPPRFGTSTYTEYYLPVKINNITADNTGSITIPIPTDVSDLNNDAGYLVSSDIVDKADKVSSPTNGNFAALDSNGNLTDSGHKHSDYLTSFTETDPIFTASAAHGISSSDISAWNGKASVTFRQWTTT